MTKAEFEALVSSVLNRGTRYDSQIEQFTTFAIQYLERNYSLKYMERYVEFTLDAGSSKPELMEYPTRRKSISFMRLLRDDEEWHYLQQGSLDQVSFIPTHVDLATYPSYYFIDSDQFVWLDKRVTDDRDGEMLYYQFTDWSAVASGSTHWLLNHAADLLLAKTIIDMAPMARTPELKVEYKKEFGELIKTLIITQEESNQMNRTEQAGFGIDYLERTNVEG